MPLVNCKPTNKIINFKIFRPMSSSLLIITTNPEILQKEDISKQMLVHLPEKKITSIYNGS